VLKGGWPWKKEDIFKGNVVLKDVTLAFDPRWPSLTNTDMTLHFQGKALDIHTSRASLNKQPIETLYATIPDLSEPLLNIQGKMNARIEKALPLLHKSPLAEEVRALASTSPTGKMRLQLGLILPLDKAEPLNVGVQGTVVLQEASLHLPKHSPLSHLSGKITFTESTFIAEKLKGKWYEAWQHFSLKREGLDGPWLLGMKGQLPAHLLPDNTHIHGMIPYTSLLTFYHPEKFKVAFSSNLVGVTSDLPGLFLKSAPEIRPLVGTFEQAQNESLLSLHLDENVHFTSTFVSKDYILTGGHLHFGPKPFAFVSKGKWLVDGVLPSWSLKEGSADGFMGNSRLPLHMNLDIGRLAVAGTEFTQVNVKLEPVKLEPQGIQNDYHIQLRSEDMRGDITLPQAAQAPIMVSLEKLHIKQVMDEVTRLSNQPPVHPIKIQIKDLRFKEKQFHQLSLAMVPSPTGYHLTHGHGQSDHMAVSLNGDWDYLLPIPHMKIEGKLTTQNVKKGIAMIHAHPSIPEAKGEAHFSVEWDGHPFNLHYPSLTGTGHFAFKEGHIPGVDTGIGRLFNLMNVDNMLRRLTLDFSDVTQKRLNFKAIKGQVTFANGKVFSKKIEIHSSSANIHLQGNADLIQKDIDLDMKVLPNVTGSLPLAAAIAAANPAVGAVVWLANKVVGPKLQPITQTQYKISGSWDTPQVTERSKLMAQRGKYPHENRSDSATE